MRRTGALWACTGVYLAALAAAWLCVRLMQGGHPLFVAFTADLAATVVVFVFSMVFDNSSIYDPYWSVAPPFIVLFWLTTAGFPGTLPARSIIVAALVIVWAARLTFNWVRRWTGIGHEDWRYRDFRGRCGSLYWPVSFFAIHLFPTLIVFLCCLPLYRAVAPSGESAGPLGLIDLAAAAVTAGAVLIETAADRQLHRHRQRSPRPGRILDSGLWARCRHPNYLGEVLFWWGVYLFGLAASPSRWWLIVGPLAMTGLFVGVSVPWMDRHLLARKQGYAEHMQRVPALLPRLSRKKN